MASGFRAALALCNSSVRPDSPPDPAPGHAGLLQGHPRLSFGTAICRITPSCVLHQWTPPVLPSSSPLLHKIAVLCLDSICLFSGWERSNKAKVGHGSYLFTLSNSTVLCSDCPMHKNSRLIYSVWLYIYLQQYSTFKLVIPLWSEMEALFFFFFSKLFRWFLVGNLR